MKRFLTKAILGGVVLALLPFSVFSASGLGRVACGDLDAPTKAMPIFGGDNYSSYCWWCVLALRTFARDEVIDSVVASYEAFEEVDPKQKFIYAEFGFPWGGRFYPHKTHRTGLSVDFHVPLKNGQTITTNIFNRYGYDAEFDENGLSLETSVAGSVDKSINFEAIRVHLTLLQKAANERGGRVKRVFFAPDLQDNLFPDAGVGHTFQGMTFNKNPSWVRHDDHYHVDFEFPCPSS